MTLQSQKKDTPPGKYPAARRGREGRDLGFHGIGTLSVLALGGRDGQPHSLADRARKEAAHGMRLPAGSLDQFLRRGAPWSFQQVKDLFGLTALSGVGLRSDTFAGFGALGGFFCRGGLLPRLALSGRHVWLPCASVGLFGGFRLLGCGSTSCGLGCFVFSGRCRHFRSPVAVATAVTTSITRVACGSKRFLEKFGQGDGKAM